jgi:C4-dicarboxylate-binding protein DctP
MFSGLVALLLAVAACPAPASAQTVLRLTFQLPMTHHLGQNVQRFKEEVEARTNGEVLIKVFPSSELFQDHEVPLAVASGQIEMGIASLTRFTNATPAVDIFYVPFLFNSDEMVRQAMIGGSPVRELLDEAILGTGARVLWWQAFGSTILLSRDRPLLWPADIAGLRVRVFGDLLGKFVEVLGGEAVLTSDSDQYEAYRSGQVQAGMTGITTVGPRRLHEVMEHVTVTNHATIMFMVIINEQVWQFLTDEQKQIISEAARDAESDLFEQIARVEAEEFALAEELGMQVHYLSPEDEAAWIEATDSVIQTYLEAAGHLGPQLIEAAHALRE